MRREMGSWLKLVFLLLLGVLQCAIHVVCVKCGIDQVTVKVSTNITECRPCPNCPDGHGLSLVCGSTIEDISMMTCVPCIAGVNYSDTHGHSMCIPCRHCDPHQNKTGQCTPKKDDTICGTCNHGYYKEVTGSCKECTWCCQNESKNRRMPDCQNAGLPENKQCAQGESAKLCAPGDNKEQGFPIGKIVAIAVGVTVAILILVAIACVSNSKTREKLKSTVFKCLQCCTSEPSDHPLSNATRNNNGRTCSTRRGRHRYRFQTSWPFTSGVVEGQLNHSHLSSVHTENEHSTSVPVPVAEQNGEASRDRLHPPESHHIAKVHSYPGYPIQSDDMSGSRKTPGTLFQQMHEQMKIGRSKGFKRFNNEEEDHDPSSSGLHCRPQDFSVDVGDSNNGRNSVDSSTEKDGDTSLDSGSTQRCCSWNRIDRNEPHSSAKGTRENTSVKVGSLSTGPVVSSVAYHSNHSRSGTEPDTPLKKVLQDLYRNGQYSSSKLDEKAGTIPFACLKDLCPIMNERRDIQFDDYRMMGEKMGLDKNSIAAAGQRSNPTEDILALFDSRKRGTVGQVMAILRVMDRDDAFRVLETWCLVTHESEML